MILLQQGNKNAHILEVDDISILFSYNTPVAAIVPGEGFYRTSETYSNTTTKHINEFLNGEDADIVTPETISSLLQSNPNAGMASLS